MSEKHISEFSFDQLFNSYYKILVAFANKYTQDIDDSEEIVQLFFTDLYEKRDSIKIQKNIKAYLFQSVYYRSLNFLKSKSNNTYVEIETPDESSNIEQNIEASEFEFQIHQLIEKLPTACREIFKLSRFENLSNSEIALQKNISKRTVETQISNALKFLRKNIYELEASESNRIKLISFFF